MVLGRVTNVIVDGSTGLGGAGSRGDGLGSAVDPRRRGRVSVYLVGYACSLSQGLLTTTVQQSIARLRAKVSELIPRVPIGFTESTRRGELMAALPLHRQRHHGTRSGVRIPADQPADCGRHRCRVVLDPPLLAVIVLISARSRVSSRRSWPPGPSRIC